MIYTAHKNQTVYEHLKNVSELSSKFASKIKLPLTGEVCGLLHDLGKYCEEFQGYIKSALGEITPNSKEFVDTKRKKGTIDHSTAGGQLIWNKRSRTNVKETLIFQIISQVIVSHHSGLIDSIKPNGDNSYEKRLNRSYDKTHLKEVLEKIEVNVLDKVVNIAKSVELKEELDKILVKIRLTKNETKELANFKLALLTRFIFSTLIDADRIDSADVENKKNDSIRLNSKYPSWDKFISLFETKISNFVAKNKIDEIRAEVSNNCFIRGKDRKGIFSLTVPTGGGKTFASLRFALVHAKKHSMDRIIYVIPFTSIIDQNVHEVQKIFAPLSEEYGIELVLEHHSNIIVDNKTVEENDIQKMFSENWDSPIVFTTTVQLLETLFNGGTKSVRRMHQLANSIIIFDEIQTLPIKTVHMFNNAMNFLFDICGSSIVLCTATQPLLHKVDKKKGAINLHSRNEIMPNITELYADLKRVEIVDKTKNGGWSTTEVCGFVKGELLIAKSVLVIVNTKKTAKELFLLCKNIDAQIYHLSTNMAPAHRMVILDKIRDGLGSEDSKPIICISTQLIEAGVDVDFGSVIRYIAGMDSIAQAAGRCNRNGKRKKGSVSIINHATENVDNLKDIIEGQKATRTILQKYKDSPSKFDNSLLSPKIIEEYFKHFFYNRKQLMDYPIPSKKIGQEDTLLNMLSSNSIACKNYERNNNQEKPPLPLLQSFAKVGKLFNAIESQTQGVIVPYNKGKDIITELCACAPYEFEKRKKLLKEAQRYSVNCYDNQLKKLYSAGALHFIEDIEVYCLNGEFYSSDFGVSDEYLGSVFNGVY